MALSRLITSFKKGNYEEIKEIISEFEPEDKINLPVILAVRNKCSNLDYIIRRLILEEECDVNFRLTAPEQVNGLLSFPLKSIKTPGSALTFVLASDFGADKLVLLNALLELGAKPTESEIDTYQSYCPPAIVNKMYQNNGDTFNALNHALKLGKNKLIFNNVSKLHAEDRKNLPVVLAVRVNGDNLAEVLPYLVKEFGCDVNFNLNQPEQLQRLTYPRSLSSIKGPGTALQYALDNFLDIDKQREAVETLLNLDAILTQEELVKCIGVLPDTHTAEIIKNGSYETSSPDQNGNLLLHSACKKYNCNLTLLAILEKRNCDVNATNKYGDTALNVALLHSKPEVCHTLLQYGADVNKCNMMVESPLHTAVKKGAINLVEKILKVQNDVNILDNDGRTPLLAGLTCNVYLEHVTKKLLECPDIEIDLVEDYETNLLVKVVELNYPADIAQMIVRHINFRPTRRSLSFSLWHIVCLCYNEEFLVKIIYNDDIIEQMVQFFLLAGADPNFIDEENSYEGDTVLDIVLQGANDCNYWCINYSRILEMLYNAGVHLCSIYAMDKKDANKPCTVQFNNYKEQPRQLQVWCRIAILKNIHLDNNYVPIEEKLKQTKLPPKLQDYIRDI